jgi:hypothetical protein
LDLFPAWPATATTDKDGRFTVKGLNPELSGALEIDGEQFTATHADIKAGHENRNQEVNLTLSPARILEGVVKAADTGKPIPKASVFCRVSSSQGNRQVICQTDEKGGYRLRVPGEISSDFPSGISAAPPEDQPYLGGGAALEWPKGAVKHRIDLALARGVAVRGTVTEAESGKPVARAVVEVVAPIDSIVQSPANPRVTTEQDGSFAVVVPPDRKGHLLVKGPNNDYVASEITYGELGGGRRDGYRVYPDAIIPFELKVGADLLGLTVKLRRGVTIRGRLLGPDDKPAGDAVMICWNQQSFEGHFFGILSRTNVLVENGTFELRGCDPKVTYPVYFLDGKNRLGASAQLSANDAAGKEVTVRLQPCGSVVVRFLNKDGKPLRGYRSGPPGIVVRPGDKGPLTPSRDRGATSDTESLDCIDNANYAGDRAMQTADAEGRCTFSGLIPGATYAGFHKALTVKPGETLKIDVTQ